MPTYDELNELMTWCTWIQTTLNGVSGRKVTSNKEGFTNKWIFLPAGRYREGAYLVNDDSHGYYWSSSLKTGSPSDAYYLKFNSNVAGCGSYVYLPRCYGLSIRPVYEDEN